MQQYSTANSGSTQLYEDSSCYFSSTRADAFNNIINNPVTDQDQQGSADDHLNGSGFLTMDDCQLMKASGFLNPNSLMMAGPDSDNAIDNPAGESNMSCSNNSTSILIGHHMINDLSRQLDFDLDDNGHDQLFHDMLVQQQNQLMQQSSHSQNLVQMQQQASATSPTSSQQQQQQQQSAAAASNWEESIHVLQEMLLLQQHPALMQMGSNGGTADHLPAQLASNINNSTIINPNSPLSHSTQFNNLKLPNSESDHLLSLLQLPRCASSSMQQTAAINPDLIRKQAGLIPLYNTNLAAGSDNLHPFYPNPPVNYHDPQLTTNLHPQPTQALPNSLSYPLTLKQLLHNVPTGNKSAASGLIHHLNEGEEAGVMKEAAMNMAPINNMNAANTNNTEEGRQFPGSLFDFKRENAIKGDAKGINHFATERQRREYLNEKYQTLRALVPNPTKADRASIVQDAIEYVKELKRTVQELQILVQEKGRSAQLKRRKISGDLGIVPDMESSSQATAIDRSVHGTKIIGGGGGANGGINDHIVGGLHLLRSSLLQRTSSHGTQVDVRIVEEEVNIKLTQKRRRNCLLDVVVVLHELHLDLLNANGATIGDHHIFMLNTKIMEGSSTYAGQVATKLIEAVDRPFCTNYLSAY